MHDVLDLKLNRVKCPATNPADRPKVFHTAHTLTLPRSRSHSGSVSSLQAYDLESKGDRFWRTHRDSPFPTVASDIEEELQAYKEAAGKVNQLAGALGEGSGGGGTGDGVHDNTRLLSDAFRYFGLPT